MEDNNKPISGPKKSKMLSIRLTEDQFQFLDSMIARIKDHTGTTVTRSSVVLKMLEYGLPGINQDFPRHTSITLDKGA